jgi:hypothetical protein
VQPVCRTILVSVQLVTNELCGRKWSWPDLRVLRPGGSHCGDYEDYCTLMMEAPCSSETSLFAGNYTTVQKPGCTDTNDGLERIWKEAVMT